MQVNMPAARRLAQLPENYADGGAVGFGARGLSQLREMIPQMQAMGFKQTPAPAPTPAPPTDPRAAQLMAMIPQMEAMGFKQKPQMLARGGMVRGPGTGTSDSIPDQAEPGTYIMPADSTAAIGPSALEKMGTVPVRLSDGEMKIPPEQVMAIGEAVLKLMKDATHTPVNGEDGGQTDAEVDDDDGARGFSPADRMAQMPQMYADGGMVDPNRPNSFGDAAAVTRDPGVTQVDSGYQPGNGTVSVVPSQPVAPPAPTRPPNTVVSIINPEWDRVAKQQNAAAPAPQNAAAALAAPPAPAVAPTAPTPAPQPTAAMGWLDRNKQRNAEVSAASIANRPEWSKTQGVTAPALPPEPPPPAPPPVDSRISMPPSTFQSRAAYGYQPRRYADGGMVEDDLQKRLMQIPSSAPPGWSGNIPTSAPPGWNGGGGGSGGGGGAGGVTGSWEAPQAAPAPAPAQPAGALTRAASMSAPAQAPAVQAMGTMPANPNGGQISTRSMGAADGLARRGAADVLAQMPNAPAPVQAPTVLTSENSWQKRNDLRNALVSASSITANGGRFDRNKGESPESLTYRAMLGTDQALQASAPGLAQAAMREQGDTQRAGLQVAASGAEGAANRQNDFVRTLLKEQGDNTRTGLTNQATLDAARLKAGASANKPLNDVQSKALQFGTRMQAAGSVLDGLASKGVDQPGLIKRAADAVGMGGAANWTQSGEQQQVEQAQRDFINAVLRRESGAAIADSEFSNARQQYFPQVGDSPEVIAQKRKNREIATAGVLAEVPDSETRVNQVMTRADANTPPARQSSSAGQPQRVESQQAFAALPSGARFVAPDGSVRVKP